MITYDEEKLRGFDTTRQVLCLQGGTFLTAEEKIGFGIGTIVRWFKSRFCGKEYRLEQLAKTVLHGANSETKSSLTQQLRTLIKNNPTNQKFVTNITLRLLNPIEQSLEKERSTTPTPSQEPSPVNPSKTPRRPSKPKQPPLLPRVANTLQDFDLPRKKFGLTGDALTPSHVPQDFQTKVAAIRACGRRRPQEGSVEDPATTVRHEAKFLGVTEVEYKAILLASGHKDPGGWVQQIENEKMIHSKLIQLNLQFDPAECGHLLELLKNHPPLGKPEYYASFYRLHEKVQDSTQKRQLQEVMRKTIEGISSLKLGQFRSMVSKMLTREEREIFEPSYTLLLPGRTDVQKSGTNRHDKIIQFINEDLTLLSELEKTHSRLDEIAKRIHSQTTATILKPFAWETGTAPLKERILLARQKLEAARALQQEWRNHPEKALRYFHATKKQYFADILKGKIAVAGGIGEHGHGYSGAFFSWFPLVQFGPIAFGFGEDLEHHARAVKINTEEVTPQTTWLGFDRAIVPDPETAQQGDVFRQKFVEDILKQEQVQRLPPDEKAILEIGLARWLENDLDVRRLAPNKWEAILTLATGEEKKGSEIAHHLYLSAPFPANITKAFQAALEKVSLSWDIEAPQQQGPDMQDTQQAHMRALIVFDTEPMLQNRLELQGGLPPISQQSVQDQCRTLGITIDGDDVPIIPWTVASIGSDYDSLFGLGQFATKSEERARYDISSKRRFF